jgi:hypothetical protein
MGIRRYKTDRFISIYGDDRHRRLVLVVEVIDAFTGKAPTIPLRVSLHGPKQLYPFRNQKGLFCFEQNLQPGMFQDQINGEYIVKLELDSVVGEWFYIQSALKGNGNWKESLDHKIILPMQDPQSPVEKIFLLPKTSYPFPANATLLRGKVTSDISISEQDKVNAIINCIYSQVDPEDVDSTIDQYVETILDSNGEYVLYFKNLPRKKQQCIITISTDSESKRLTVEIEENTTSAARVVHFS